MVEQQLVCSCSQHLNSSLPSHPSHFHSAFLGETVIGKIIDEKVTERNDCLLLKVLTRISTKLMQSKQHFGAYPTH